MSLDGELSRLLTGWRELPGLQRLRTYQRANLPGDLSAGLLVAALAIPQALGYATVAGVPVQVGLYTLPPALIAYALFGTSRVLFVGPVSTVTVLSGSIVRQMSGGDASKAAALTSALAITAGLLLIVVGLIRIGWVAQFLSEPIVMGFVTGLVVLIIVGEIPGLLGLPTPSGALLDRLWALIRNSPHANPVTVAVSLGALLVLFGGQRLFPRMPWALVALVGGVLASDLAGLAGHGVKLVGHVPGGLPLPALPVVPLESIGGLVTGGVAVAAVGIAEGLAAARTFATPDDVLRDDTEFVANGVSDLASGIFGGMGVAGSLSKTAANARAGARTQVSGLAGAAAVLLVLILFATALEPLPKAVLSAIVIHAVWGLLHPKEFNRFRKVRRNDGIAATVAFIGVLALGPLNGLLVAIGQSLAGLVYRSMQVHVDEMGRVPGEKAAWGSLDNGPDRKPVKRICVVRPDGPIFWANAAPVFERIRGTIAGRPDARVVLLDLEATNQMDTTTAEKLHALLTDLRARGVELYLVRVFANVRDVLGKAGVLDDLGDARLWHSISAGVKAAKKSGHLVVDGVPADEDDDTDVVRPPRRPVPAVGGATADTAAADGADLDATDVDGSMLPEAVNEWSPGITDELDDDALAGDDSEETIASDWAARDAFAAARYAFVRGR